MDNNNSQRRFDKVSLDSMAIADGKAHVDELGILRGVCPVTRCGVFLYINPDGSERRELRPREEVFSPHTLDSLKMIPITMDHPEEGYVDSTIAKREGIGSTGETVKESGDFVFASVVVYDKDAVEAITSKRICELSLGYMSDIDSSCGEYEGEPYDCIQRNIIYNHLSVVERGRAGSNVRIITDSLGECMTQKKDAQEIPRDAQIKAPIKPQTLNEEFDMHIRRMDSRIDSMEQNIDSLKSKMDRVLDAFEKKEDGEEEKRKAEAREAMDAEEKAKLDSAVRSEASRRAKYLMAASERLTKKEYDGLVDASTSAIRDAVLAKVAHVDSLEGRNEDYLEALFDISSQIERKSGRVRSIPHVVEEPRADSEGKFKLAKDVPVASINVERE